MSRPQIGIFSRSYNMRGASDLFRAVAADGFESVHFNFRSAGLEALPGELDAETCAAIRTTATAQAVQIAGVSATFNAIHPDIERRRLETTLAFRVISSAPILGAGLVSLCTGTRDPDDMWRGHPANTDASAWDDLRRTLEILLQAAHAAGVVLGIEPELANVVSSAARARRLLDEFDDSHIKIILDPANLVQPGVPAAQEEVLTEAFELLSPDVAILHAKDVGAEGGCAAGLGELDYALVAELVSRHNLAVPIVLHEVEEHDIARARDFVLGQLRAVTAESPSGR